MLGRAGQAVWGGHHALPLPHSPQLLTAYWAAHGCGLVSQHRVLAWTGKLQAQDVLKGRPGREQREGACMFTALHSTAAVRIADTPHALTVLSPPASQARTSWRRLRRRGWLESTTTQPPP